MSQDPFHSSLSYAIEAHRHQLRKGTQVPFVSHVLRVGLLVQEHGGSDVEIAAGFLHDVAEDAGGQDRLDDVRARFGDEVADIVAACSDTFELPKPPWRERKEAHLRHLEEATRSVLVVTAADKLDNVRSILADLKTDGESVWGRFKGGKEGTVWYYESMASTLSRRLRGELTEKLASASREIAAVAQTPIRSP